MHHDELMQLIVDGGSEAVEFKKSAGMMREAVETICAFANHHGGYLIVGIDDDGSVTGQHVSDDTLKNVANEIKLNTEPRLYPSIEKVKLSGKDCILVTIEESPLKPHLAYGRPFLRVGPTNQRMDREQYQYLLQQRYNGYGFDTQILPQAGIQDIDLESLFKFVETANSVRDLNENTMLPPEIILEKLDLIRDGHLTKAALLLFGHQPEKYFLNHFEIKCGIFITDDGYDQVINEKEYKQNLFNNFELVLYYILEAIKKNSRKGRIHRLEAYEFPAAVIREAVVNMIVHRDYRQDIKSTVEIRPSAISLNNPAQLFTPTISIERLKQYHPSRPGNKLIARIFYLLRLFENWGGGTLKIVNETVKSGKKEPQFSYSDGIFRLELLR